jgi:D-alanyl-D-alanine carboxypeptidase/D-alanyl-D-alanine-endopeptidase (penicillin-binding protein 4)
MTHRLFLSLVCLACLWLWAGPAQGRAGSDLNADVRKVLSEKYLSGAQVGVAVARLGDSAEPHWLIRHASTTPLIPASNLKLVTTAAALEQLGADFSFNTALLM